MIRIRQAFDIEANLIDKDIPSDQDITLDARGLTLLPGLIDPHVHFRTPGLEHKENWLTAAQACIRGGYTTVFDMPNTLPPTITQQRLADKKQLIEQQLKEIGIPLRYQLFFGADKHHFDQIVKIKDEVVGIKVFMGSSTGELLMDDDSSLHAIFAIAARHKLIVAVHAEDECLIQARMEQFRDETDYAVHSRIRNPEVAAIAVKKAISLSEMYGTHLYILHVSTQNELQLIAEAKQAGLPVYAETTPHHLFLTEDDYAQWGGFVQMNPPLRSKEHQQALFHALHTGIIDTIGSDHAPHTRAEKSAPYRVCMSGVPGIETTLPLLLDAHHRGLLTLSEIVQLTSTRAKKIFSLADNNDVVLVDLNKTKTITDEALKTKCAWSPFTGRTLTGWPVTIILRGQLFNNS